MRETLCTDAGLSVESWGHIFGLFKHFLSRTRTKGPNHWWSYQNKDFTSNLLQAPLSLYLANSLVLSDIRKKKCENMSLVVSICTVSCNKHFPFNWLILLETYLSNPQNVMHKPRKNLRVQEISRDTRQVFLHIVGPHACMPQCECTLMQQVFPCQDIVMLIYGCLFSLPHWRYDIM